MGTVADIFDPDVVAVVGATEREGSIGRAVTANLLEDFDGTVVPVNPGRDAVLGQQCYSALGDVPSEIDLVVVVVPAPAAVETVDEAASAGVENVVVISAGFREAGDDGTALEDRLVGLAEEHDLNLVGPNSLGVISTPSGLNATFAEGTALPGLISFLSQSGAFIAAVLDWAATRNLGFKDIVSLGNEAVLDEVDFVNAWGEDPATDVILGYVEDIDDGRRFIDAARTVSAETPVVMLKSGRTAAGARAAASHTGSLAGSDRAYDAAFEQAGVIRADSVQELFDYGQVLAGERHLSNQSVGILTNAGGPGVLAADAVEDTPLSLAAFEQETQDRLEAVVPANATVRNPLDIIGDADLDRYRRSLEAILDDGNVGCLLVIACPTAIFDFEEFVEVVCDAAEGTSTPVVTCLMGGESATTAARTLAEDRIPNFFDPARAIESLGALADYQGIRAREYSDPRQFDVDEARAQSVIDDAIDLGLTQLGAESMALLDAYGIPTPDGAVVESASAAADVAERLGDDVVMKIVSPDIVHKSDIGGVEVGVASADAADTYDQLVSRATGHDPDARILGVLVQELVAPEDSVEVIAGMNRDPQFGPLVMFGLGGVFVEVMEDISFRVAPLADSEARAMTDEIQSSPLLHGARGREPVDVDAVVETLQRLAQLAVDFPQIRELDVNPLVASPDGAIAVDLRLTLESDDENQTDAT